MKILERWNKLIGNIKVSEKNNLVKVVGIDALIMRQYIKTYLETDVVAKFMFTSMTDTSFSISSFFLPDLLYILTKLKEDPNCKWGTKSSLEKIIQGIHRETWFGKTLNDPVPIIDPKRMKLLAWKPMEKQLDFLLLYGDRIPRYDLNGYILAFGPGGGKTFSSLLTVACVIPPSVAEVKIIISPKKALHLVWEKSVRQVFKKKPTYWCSDSKEKMPISNTEYYIFNYESLDKAIELAKSLNTRNVKYFVIADESHNFADYKSQRTQKLVTLQTLRDDTYFIWISGTPILKSAAELTAFLKCADPRFDSDAYQRFKKIYTVAPGRANEIFNHRLGSMMAFLVPKSAFSKEKPTVKELPVKLPPSLANKFLMETVREEMKEFIKERLTYYDGEMKRLRGIVNKLFDYHYDTLTSTQSKNAFRKYLKDIKILSRHPDMMLSELLASTRDYERSKLIPSIPPGERKEFRSSLSAIKNIKLKVRGEALGTILSKRRSECAAALAYYCKPDQIMKESLSKTLFFASSVLPIKVLEQHLKEIGFNPILVYGGTNSQLTRMMEEFDTNPTINPVCATMQSLSEAVPVTAASTVVLLNRPFRQAAYEQVVARADRLGQKHPVTVIEVTLDTGDKPNVSSTTDDILANVRMLINEIVGEDFSGPDPDEREYASIIDASQEDPSLLKSDELMGL